MSVECFVLRYFLFVMSVWDAAFINFYLRKQKGHRCIIVSASVRVPSEAVMIPDAQYKPWSCFDPYLGKKRKKKNKKTKNMMLQHRIAARTYEH